MVSPKSSLGRMRCLWSWLQMQGVLPYALLIIAALMMVGVAWGIRGSATQQPYAAASSLVAAAEAEVALSMGQFDLTLQAVMDRHQSPALQTLGAQARNTALFERAQRDSNFAFINVLDETGGFIAGLPQNDNHWNERDYFIEQRNRSVTDIYIGRAFSTEREDKVGFPVSRRMTDSDGNFIGVVVMGVRLAYFRDLFSKLEPGPGISVELLRDDGLILMRQPFDLNDINRTLTATAPFYEFKRTGLSSITTHEANGSVEHRFLFRRVGTLPLVVSVSTTTTDTDANSMLWWLVPAGMAIVVALVLGVRWLSRQMRRREAAERESREKSRFLITLSHELRTPLHGVLGYADQLSREGHLSADQSRQVMEIVRAGKLMRDVVNVVLDYARVEALGPTPHMRRFSVRHLVEQCLAVVEPSARARGLDMQITIAPSTPTHFVTDDVQLRQILVNLLSNAVKYTPRGMIELRLKGDEGSLTIEVADSGIGIPEGQRHRLFKEFERFGTERSSIEGTGLGLAIAHRLARRMGGHLGHRDNPGGGSVFWLKLPAGIADEPDALAEAREIAPHRRLNVLVVDDSVVSREVAAAFLRQAGHAATEARDGDEAVRLVAAQDFDVVLMDMRMTGVDGLEATRSIRAMAGPRADVPIVAVTANALDEHAEECRRAGMSQHLAKPFTQAELIAVVMRAIADRAHAPCNALPTFDPDIMAELTSCMDADAIQGLLDCLSLRIQVLLRRLDEPTPFTASEALAELTHELAGSAGALGFSRLSMIATRFQTAITANPTEAGRMVAEIQREAEAALAELRHRRELEDMSLA